MLDEQYQLVIQLFYFQDYSISMISEQMGVPEGTVKTHLYRARKLLKQTLRRRRVSMERKEMKKLYDEIDVPMVEVTSAIRQAIGDVKAEQKRHWFKWNWRTPVYSVIALVVLYFSSGFLFPSLNTAMARVPIIGQFYMMFHDKVGMSLFRVIW